MSIKTDFKFELMERFEEETKESVFVGSSFNLAYVRWLEFKLLNEVPNTLNFIDIDGEILECSINAVDKYVEVTSTKGLCIKIVDEKIIKIFNKKN